MMMMMMMYVMKNGSRFGNDAFPIPVLGNRKTNSWEEFFQLSTSRMSLS